jgi:hypothetical protein
VYFARQPFD